MFHSYDDISLFMLFTDVSESLGSLFQPIPAIAFIKAKVGWNGPAGLGQDA
jgi:hypothetical protein